MRSLALFAAASLFLANAPTARAYVTYQRLGYISCTACHFVPIGGGLLSAYGTSTGASMSAIARDLDPPEKRFTAGVQLRVLRDDSSGVANPFVMQADLLANAFITKQLHADIQVGPEFTRGPTEVFTLPTDADLLVFRRALLTERLDDSNWVEVGRDLPVVGLNIADHSSLLRSRNRRNVFDYPTQIRYYMQSERLLLMPFLMAPSYEEKDENREYGAGGRAEYALSNSDSVGLTAQFGDSPSLSRLVAGPFARLSYASWNGLVTEALFTSRRVHASGTSFPQETIHVKPYVAIPEWLETGFVFEYLHVGGDFTENSHRYGPSLNARIHEYVSALFDARNSGNTSQSDWSWYGTLFVHFQI